MYTHYVGSHYTHAFLNHMYTLLPPESIHSEVSFHRLILLEVYGTLR